MDELKEKLMIVEGVYSNGDQVVAAALLLVVDALNDIASEIGDLNEYFAFSARESEED